MNKTTTDTDAGDTPTEKSGGAVTTSENDILDGVAWSLAEGT